MKDVQNREHTALAKPLVAIGELQCDYVSSKNDQPNKKNLFRHLLCQKKIFLLPTSAVLIFWLTPCLITLTIESSIINTNSNITDNMMRTVMHSRKSVGLRMEPWRTLVLTGYSCKDFPSRITQNHVFLRKEEIRPNVWLQIP